MVTNFENSRENKVAYLLATH